MSFRSFPSKQFVAGTGAMLLLVASTVSGGWFRTDIGWQDWTDSSEEHGGGTFVVLTSPDPGTYGIVYEDLFWEDDVGVTEELFDPFLRAMMEGGTDSLGDDGSLFSNGPTFFSGGLAGDEGAGFTETEDSSIADRNPFLDDEPVLGAHGTAGTRNPFLDDEGLAWWFGAPRPGVTSTTPGPNGFFPPIPPPPLFTLSVHEEWQQDMLSYGTKTCNYLLDTSAPMESRKNSFYYDAAWTFYQIGDYTGDHVKWDRCAQAAVEVYRDGYVFQNTGHNDIPGYWAFTTGLKEHYLRTGDMRSLEAINIITHQAAFLTDDTGNMSNWDVSREAAYAIRAYLTAEELGAGRRERLATLEENALGHLDQWFGSETSAYVKPFMVALTVNALKDYNQRIGDPRIVPAVRDALLEMWRENWLPGEKSFVYQDRPDPSSPGGAEASPDLNLLIYPGYAWMCKETGERQFCDMACEMFTSGVRLATLINDKVFNQSYSYALEEMSRPDSVAASCPR